MTFKIYLQVKNGKFLTAHYPYSLSAAIYRIIAKGDATYADFLHEEGYGKGFKLFTFSQLSIPFQMEGDRMRLKGNEGSFQISFHLPEAMETFVKGLFQSEEIVIADKKSRVSFAVTSVETLSNPLQQYKDNEVVNLEVKPLSPIVAGLTNDKGNYDFLAPDDPRFTESLIYNWRNKIATCHPADVARTALLMLEVIPMKNPARSRLITIKANTTEETKIRGWMNFGLKITAEKRFVDLLLNAGVGLYNAQGMGCVGVWGRTRAATGHTKTPLPNR